MKIGWGIDVGVASLGFAVVVLDEQGHPARLIDGTALVYPAPLGGAERTRHRSTRTQYKRRAKRIKALRSELARLLALEPGFDAEHVHPDLADGEKADGKPRRNTSRVRLRAYGLSEPLTAGDLARAVLHIAKNRGQRLTRGLKDDSKADAEQKKRTDKERQSMADAANTTSEQLTVLGERLGLGGPAHPSQLFKDKTGGTEMTRLKKGREGTPVFTRGMVQAELDALLEAQRPYHEALTDGVCKTLREMVFEEAEPKAPAIGKCRYGKRGADGEIETRLPRGSDLFQRKRIFEEVNNLRIVSARTAAERLLTLDQRNCLVERLLNGEKLTAAKVRDALRLGRGARADTTSLDIRRKGRKTAGELQGHPLAAAMRKAGALDRWREFDDGACESIACLVRTEDDKERLCYELQAFDLPPNAIQALSDARLPATYSAAGETATRELLAALETDVISNHEAEKRAGLEESDPPPPCLNRLPYYGTVLQGWCVGGDNDACSNNEARFGRIPNPVVHVALNQLRKTANAYLRLYGKPERICVELARDMNKSAEEREKTEEEANKNRKANERYVEQAGVHTRKLTPAHLRRMKLHRMQGGECLYTGRNICMEQLFDGHSVEIDHILPYATTRDSSIANLALVFAEANQMKGKRTPFKAFSNGYKGQDYEHILRRAKQRGGSVYWRFREDAMERYQDQDAFQSRFLNDTRYIARMVARYLSSVCADPNGVVSLNGRITSDLRHQWGLHTLIRDIMAAEGCLDLADFQLPEGGECLAKIRERRKRADKIRWDHRHHLLDAIVAACTTRSDVQRLQTRAARDTRRESAGEILAEIRRDDRHFANGSLCWQPGFREVVKAFLQERAGDGAAGERPPTSVVRKADHDTRGQLHEARNYGVICEVPKKTGQYVARDHASLPELTVDRIKGLGVPPTVVRAVEQATEAGTRIWWGGDRPVSALHNLAKDLAGLRTALLNLMNEAPDEILANARTENGRQQARAKWAIEQYIGKTGRRRYTRVQIVSLRILKGPLHPGKKPRQANPTGANDRLVYFIDGKGKRDLEVVSTLDANRPRFEERWRREGGRPLFVLRRDDLVEMTTDSKDPASPRRLYRTVSFSYSGSPDLEFLPVEEARAPKQAPKHVRTRITNTRAFSDRAPVMVVCDPTGRERWRSRRLN